MKSIILKFSKTLLLLSAILCLSSCVKEIDDFNLPDPPKIQKKVEFDEHAIEVIGNAAIEIVDGEVQIKNLGKADEPFSFYVRPLTDDYWINILFNDLILAKGKEVSSSRFIKNKETGERSMIANTTFNVEGMTLDGEVVGKSANLLVATPNGGWEEPFEDIEMERVQGFWPWDDLLDAAEKALTKIDYTYKESTTQHPDGSTTTTSTHTVSLGSNQALTDGNGLTLGEPDEMNHYELTWTPEPITGNIAPRTIDGMEVTCTGYPVIKIGAILNGRAPL